MKRRLSWRFLRNGSLTTSSSLRVLGAQTDRKTLAFVQKSWRTHPCRCLACVLAARGLGGCMGWMSGRHLVEQCTGAQVLSSTTTTHRGAAVFSRGSRTASRLFAITPWPSAQSFQVLIESVCSRERCALVLRNPATNPCFMSRCFPCADVQGAHPAHDAQVTLSQKCWSARRGLQRVL